MESKELLELISLENSLTPLKNRFNEHKSKMRFIALLSPS
jgi:hypothetical protein